MANLLDNFPENYVTELVSFYKQAYLEILKQQRSITPTALVRNREILRNIDSILGQLDEKTRDWLQTNITDAYKKASDQALEQLKEAGYDTSNASFNQIHEDAVKIITSETYVDYANAMSFVKKESERLVNQATKESIKVELAKSAIEGKTLEQSKKVIADLIAKSGATALRDKGGKAWQLDNYAEMLTRTKMMQVHNAGISNRALEYGSDLVEVTNHFGSCGLCSPFEGKIYSLTGATPGVPLLQSAIDNGLFHPNCKHTIAVWHENIAGNASDN